MCNLRKMTYIPPPWTLVSPTTDGDSNIPPLPLPGSSWGLEIIHKMYQLKNGWLQWFFVLNYLYPHGHRAWKKSMSAASRTRILSHQIEFLLRLSWGLCSWSLPYNSDLSFLLGESLLHGRTFVTAGPFHKLLLAELFLYSLFRKETDCFFLLNI